MYQYIISFHSEHCSRAHLHKKSAQPKLDANNPFYSDYFEHIPGDRLFLLLQSSHFNLGLP